MQTWETRYILLLWLTFLLLIPFDLRRMDGTSPGSGNGTIDRVFDVARLYVGISGKCQDGAAVLLAR